MNSKISVYTIPFSNITSYHGLIDIATEYGISSIETLNICELTEPDIDKAKLLRSYADEKGISFSCVSIGVDLVGDNRSEQIDTAKKYVHIASILGSPYLHHTIAPDFCNYDEMIKNKEPYYERGLLAVREIFDYARSAGIRTVYEDQGFIFNGISAFKRFIHDVERDVGIVADLGNLMFLGDKIEDFIPEFSGRIVNVHVKDYKYTQTVTCAKDTTYKAYDGRYFSDCPLGKGNVDLKKAFECLKSINYNGCYALESVPCGNEEESFIYNLNVLSNLINEEK